MAVEKFSISMMPEVLAQIEARREAHTPRAFLINRELDRYYALLARARARLRGKLSAAEIGLICDVCNGTLWEATTIPFIGGEVEEAIRYEHADQKWDVDGAGLIATLNGLDLAERFALVDAVERFWQGAYRKDAADYATVLTWPDLSPAPGVADLAP